MRTKAEIQSRDIQVKSFMEKSNIPERLYHYTSFASLYGIMKNKEIWYGNTATMNDKSEVIGFINRLNKALEEELAPEYQKKREAFFEKMYTRLTGEYPFALCFSRLKDNAAQWERYADNARGVCITFNAERFVSLIFHNYLGFGDVFYDYNIKEHAHFEIVKHYLCTDKLTRAFENEKGLIDNILACGYSFKHESFKTEEEVRSSTFWNETPPHSKVEFVSMNGRIKKVLKLNLEEICSEECVEFEDLFEEITIAPCSEQNEYELISFLKSFGLDKLAGNVKKSECPLR